MPVPLDHYRLLGRSGLRVSPLALGTMTFGTEWGWGSDEETSRRILDAYADRGGNFIDTADLYTGGTSERFVGSFLDGRRDRFVIATKFAFAARQGDPNSGGNHRKRIREAIEASLGRLGTDYIDLLWVHAWDGLTPAEEMMRALDDAVAAGKVCYLGVSNFPAWKVAQCQTLADLRGWTPLAAMQIEYSLAERSVERELLPMALDVGLGVMPWSPLAQGALTGKYLNAPNTTTTPHAAAEAADPPRKQAQDSSTPPDAAAEAAGNPTDPRPDTDISTARLTLTAPQGHGDKYRTDRVRAIAAEVVAIARDLGATPSQVAIAWLLHRRGVTSPIIGARRLAHLEDNLAAADLDLPAEALARLDVVSRIEPGYPHDFLAGPPAWLLTGGTRISRPVAGSPSGVTTP